MAHMAWRNKHAGHDPGDERCQGCSARRITRHAALHDHAQRSRHMPAGPRAPLLARAPAATVAVTAGGNGRLGARVALRVCGARCAIAQRTAHSRGLRQSPRGCRWRRHLRRRHRCGSVVSRMTTFCTESIESTSAIHCSSNACDAQGHASSQRGQWCVCKGMAVAAHPLTRACEPPQRMCSASMRACVGKRRETRRVARVRCRKACGKGVRTRAHAWAMRCTPGQQSRTRVPAKQRFVDRFQ